MIYLDNAATTFPKPTCVKEAMVDFFDNIGSSSGRSGHTLSVGSGRVVYECREALSELIGQDEPFRTIFTSSATHSLNLAIKGLLKRGDTVVTTSLEHNSVARVLNHLASTLDIKIKIIPCIVENHHLIGLDLVKARELIKGAKLLISVHANNVSGVILPIDELSLIARENGALFLCDVAQSVGTLKVDMSHIDIACGSGHKGLFGMSGTGFVSFGKRVNLEEIEPIFHGGTGSKSEEEVQPSFLPDKFESGTLNCHGIASLNAGIEFVKVNDIKSHEQSLRAEFLEGLKSVPHVKVLTSDYECLSSISLLPTSISVSEFAYLLDNDFGVLTRAGLHCSPSSHKTFNTFENGGTVRFSAGFFNTTNDIDYTINAIKKILK